MTKKRTVIMILDSLGTQKNGKTAEAFRQAKLLNSLGHKVVIAPFACRKKQHYVFLSQKIRNGLWNTVLEEQPNQLQDFEAQTSDALIDVQVSKSLSIRKESFEYLILGKWIDTLEKKYNHPVFINWDRQYDTMFFNCAYVHSDIACIAAIRGNLISKKGTPKSAVQKLAKRGDAFIAFMFENAQMDRYLSGYFGRKNNSFLNPSNSEEWAAVMESIDAFEVCGDYSYQEVPTITKMSFKVAQDIEDDGRTFTNHQIELTVDTEDDDIRFYMLPPLPDVTIESAKESSFVFEPFSMEKETNSYKMEFMMPKKIDSNEEQAPSRLELQYKRNVCLYNLDPFEVEQGDQENGN